MTRAFDTDENGHAAPGWAALVSTVLSSAGERAPSEGFQGLWRDEWERAGTWTKSERSDPFDVGPFGWMLSSSGETVDELAWSKPNGLSVAAFDIYVVDIPGAGDWQYRVDEGAWNRVGPATSATANRLRRVAVDTPVRSRLQIRGSDGTNPCVAAVAGIDVVLEAGDARRFRTHDLSAGRHFLSQFCRPTAGDPLAVLDEIQPALIVVAFSNDVLFRAPVKFEHALRAIVDRVSPYGDAVLVGAYEQRPPRVVHDAELMSGSPAVVSDTAKFLPSDVGEKLLFADLPEAKDVIITAVQSKREATMSAPAAFDAGAAELTIGFGRTVEDQDRYRKTASAVSESTGSAFVDIYQAWRDLGCRGWAEAFDAGLMLDRYHASARGHRDIANRLLELIGREEPGV